MNCDFVLHIPADISAEACAAARATLRAAELQAKAARDAGHWAAAGGVAAIVAAVLALFGVQKSAFYQEQSTKSNREFEIRQEVFFAAGDALLAGLLTVTRLSDLQTPIKDAMADYLSRLPNLGRAHLVADPKTVSLVLGAVNKLAATHNEIIRERLQLEQILVQRGQEADPLDIQIALNKACLQCIPELNGPLLDTLGAFREALGLPVDVEALKLVVSEASETAQKQAAGFFGSLVSDRDRRNTE